MTLTRRLQPLAVVVDQAWLSLVSLAVSIALIREAPKAEYGHYLLLVAPLLLLQSVQNALINSPLATYLPAAQESEGSKIKATAISLHIHLAVFGAMLYALGLLAFGWLDVIEISTSLVVSFSAAVVGTIARESQRSLAYAQGAGLKALSGDIVFGVLMVMGVGLAASGAHLYASTVLLLTGIAGVAPVLLQVGTLTRPRVDATIAVRFWSCSRWALPSVLATWGSLNSYSYFAGVMVGVTAVAEIGAARLFVMPIGLIIAAWGNWNRPRISRWFAAGDIRSVRHLTHSSVLLGLGTLGGLAALLTVVYPWIEQLIGSDYAGLKALVLMWMLYFALSLCRNIYMATLMIDANGYRILHHITWGGLFLSVGGLATFSSRGSIWIVGVLCAVELTLAISVIISARAYWRRPRAGGPPRNA